MVLQVRIELTSTDYKSVVITIILQERKQILAEHEGLEPPRPHGRLISNQLQYHCANAPF